MIRPLVLAGFISCICFAKEFLVFERVISDDGKLCVHELFTQPCNMLTKCAMLCEINPGCTRFFFIPGNNGCMGCLDLQIQTTTASGSIGYNVLKQQMTYIGCYSDAPSRVLNGAYMVSSSLTNEMCWQYCIAQGFIYSGTQYASHCFCGNSYQEVGKRPESECNIKCSGDPNQICGGGYRNSIYT